MYRCLFLNPWLVSRAVPGSLATFPSTVQRFSHQLRWRGGECVSAFYDCCIVSARCDLLMHLRRWHRRVQLQQLRVDLEDDEDSGAQPKQGAMDSPASKGYDSEMYWRDEAQAKSDWKSEQDVSSRRPRLVSNDSDFPTAKEEGPAMWGRHRLASHSSSAGGAAMESPSLSRSLRKQPQDPLDGCKMEPKAANRCRQRSVVRVFTTYFDIAR